MKRTLVKGGHTYKIVRWDAMPPEAPVPSFHVWTATPRTTSVWPTFAQAEHHAQSVIDGRVCPMQTLPIYEETP